MIDVPQEPMVFAAGTLIAGRYEVVTPIGSGGMGWVLHVLDRELERRSIALKLLYPHLVKDERIFTRFRRELLVTRELSHPNIVRMYDLGRTENNYHFISLEFVHGHSLKDLISGHSGLGVPVPDAIRILHDITQGVAYAHEQGVIHRDLKPDNVLVSSVGEVKICDFGIARTLWQENGLTKTGGAVGTPYYMAPEQIRGEEADHRTDIYSLGIIGFELLTGMRPFDDDNFYKLAHMHMNEPLPAEALGRVGAPDWLIDVVKRCAAKSPDERYEDASEILEELRTHVPTGRITLRPLSGVHSVSRKAIVQEVEPYVREQRRTTRILAGLMTLIILAINVYFTIHVRENDSSRAIAGGIIVSWERAIGFHMWPLRAYAGFWNVRIGEPLEPLLFRAIAKNDKWETKLFFDAGVSPDVRNELGETPLHVWAKVKDAENDTLIRLIKDGADVNALDARGETPLLAAIKAFRHWENLPRLLEVPGVNPDARDSEGTPAIILGAITIRNLAHSKSATFPLISAYFTAFMKAGARFDVADKDGVSLLHIVSSIDFYRQDLLDLCIGSKRYLDSPDPEGMTPLLRAAQSGSPFVVEALLNAGASPFATDHLNRNVLTVARSEIRPTVEELLRVRGIDPESLAPRTARPTSKTSDARS